MRQPATYACRAVRPHSSVRPGQLRQAVWSSRFVDCCTIVQPIHSPRLLDDSESPETSRAQVQRDRSRYTNDLADRKHCSALRPLRSFGLPPDEIPMRQKLLSACCHLPDIRMPLTDGVVTDNRRMPVLQRPHRTLTSDGPAVFLVRLLRCLAVPATACPLTTALRPSRSRFFFHRQPLHTNQWRSTDPEPASRVTHSFTRLL